MTNADPSFKCIHTHSTAGDQARDPRPLIVKLIEVERIPEADRTVVQAEALDLWQSQIGDPDVRDAIESKFSKALGGFADYLTACGLGATAQEVSSTGLAALIELTGDVPSPAVDTPSENP
tara:strand:- start:104 stop:466 length:363 start_codon:yes stop_codon:yes gene_type:complete